jgi:hypothetical protein
MKISNANFTYELPHQHATDTALPPVSNQNKGKVSYVTQSAYRNLCFYCSHLRHSQVFNVHESLG